MLPSKYEPIRYFIFEQDVYLLASSCSNDYFHADAIIYFLGNRLVFQNMVIFVLLKFLLLIHLRLTEVLHKLTAWTIASFLAKQLPRQISLWINLLLGQKLIKQDDFLHVLYLHVNNFISRDISTCQILPSRAAQAG